MNEAPDFYIYSEFNEVKEFKVSPIVPLVLVLILLDNSYHGCTRSAQKGISKPISSPIPLFKYPAW